MIFGEGQVYFYSDLVEILDRTTHGVFLVRERDGYRIMQPRDPNMGVIKPKLTEAVTEFLKQSK